MRSSWVDTWRYQANCLGNYIEDLWFPNPYNTKGRALVLKLARESFCDDCPVKAQCARHAIETRSCGVWAGEWIPADRRSIPPDVKLRLIALAARAGWAGRPEDLDEEDDEGEADVDFDDAA